MVSSFSKGLLCTTSLLDIFCKCSLILLPLLGRFYLYFWNSNIYLHHLWNLVNSDSVGLGRVQDSAFLTGSWVVVMDYIHFQ